MLSVFPALLTFGLFSATIIRVIVGGTLLYFGVLTLTSKRKKLALKLSDNKYPAPRFVTGATGIINVIVGGFLIVGFLTQVSALVAAYGFLNLAIFDGKKKIGAGTDSGVSSVAGSIFGQSALFHTVLIFVSLTLLFSGAGFLAIDLPI